MGAIKCRRCHQMWTGKGATKRTRQCSICGNRFCEKCGKLEFVCPGCEFREKWEQIKRRKHADNQVCEVRMDTKQPGTT